MHCACMTYCAGIIGADQLNIALIQAHLPETMHINGQVMTVRHCWKGAEQGLVPHTCILLCTACKTSMQTTMLDLQTHIAAIQAAV
jgi:hypothetical protein